LASSGRLPALPIKANIATPWFGAAKGDVEFLSLAERFLPSIIKSIDLLVEGFNLPV
jgi:hypothetical protein